MLDTREKNLLWMKPLKLNEIIMYEFKEKINVKRNII